MKIRLLVSLSGPEVSLSPRQVTDWPEEEAAGLIAKGYAEALDESEGAKLKAEEKTETAEAPPAEETTAKRRGRTRKARAPKAEEKAEEASAEAAPEPPLPPLDGWRYKGGA